MKHPTDLTAPAPTSDVNITETRTLASPEELIRAIPKTESQAQFVTQSREAIHRISFGDDDRLLVIVGPCSIHDLDAGREYADRLAQLAGEVRKQMLLVMRVYFEKPRTTVGWKGLIMDPHLDGTYDIPAGLKVAREFLLEVLERGLPTATELLDPITPQYIADLICWSAIGARTTESQTHRQMASGLSMPLGFKNGTDGLIQTAINAIRAAGSQQRFLGIDAKGRASALTTRGNPNCHLVLRGGRDGPNYEAAHVHDAAKKLEAAGLIPAVMIDCAHDNSQKTPERSLEVFRNVVSQACAGDRAVIGAMLESNLQAGSQQFPQPKAALQRGVSITDPCIDWGSTHEVIREAARDLAEAQG
ncbi:MAG: 3-deoxy-7-phosphoheptulonate synthase [Opitutales bacterium]